MQIVNNEAEVRGYAVANAPTAYAVLTGLAVGPRTLLTGSACE